MSVKRILIIDDEIDIREIAKLSLEISKGWKVLLAASGKEGLTLAQDQQPDAILLDVTMPDMDGPMVSKILQENPTTKDIPIIFLTAKVQMANPNYYSSSGAKAVLIKPFDPVMLANQIETALAWNA